MATSSPGRPGSFPSLDERKTLGPGQRVMSPPGVSTVLLRSTQRCPTLITLSPCHGGLQE
ncbi:hypothetical protein BgiBS90_028797, partial [Biomphalaria glabrata]